MLDYSTGACVKQADRVEGISIVNTLLLCQNRFAPDHSRLTEDIMGLNDCDTTEQVRQQLDCCREQLGFDHFLYSGSFFVGGDHQVRHVESNHSEQWLQTYAQRGYAEVDPTVCHAASSLAPLVWSDRMYRTDAQRQFQGEAHRHRLIAGVTFPIQKKDVGSGLLSLSLSSGGTAAAQHIQQTLVWGPLLATLTHEIVAKLIAKAHAPCPPKVTKRESDVLQWIAAGKSTWEISKLLNISEHGVIHHVRNLLLKFGVSSRHQVVLKALMLGIL